MHEPASRELIAKLEQFTACRERDLSECRRFVRQLSRDLPAFDSIWLDALVQARKLTPFQADRLVSGREASLLVGRFQLIGKLSQDRVHVRYLGRDSLSGQRVFVEEFQLQGQPQDQSRQALADLKSRIAPLSAAPQILVPLDFVFLGESLFAVYPYERGLTARELLIRRGRFPEKLVRTLSLQLLQQVRTLSAGQLIHGDIRATNVLLHPSGRVILLNAGLRPCIAPHWTVQTPLPYESYDTLAPEVVKTGQWTVAADMYSLGCLLWQFACGRPPLHSADPLLKLKTHLEKSVPDAREYAPDLDEETALRIHRLTRRVPAERFTNLESPGEKQITRQGARQLIGRFVREFEQPPPGAVHPSRVGRTRQSALPVLAACLLVLIFWQGWRMTGGLELPGGKGNPWLLSISTAHTAEPDETIRQTPERGLSTAIQLPRPDEQGRVLLTPGQRYRAEDISVVGPLWIGVTEREANSQERPAARGNAIIEVEGQPWRLWGTDVSLQQVSLEYRPAGEVPPENPSNALQPPPALLVCQSLNFQAEQCRWESAALPGGAAFPIRGIAWKPLESSEVNSGRLRLQHCAFHQAGSSVMLGGATRLLEFHNCLKTGPGELLEVSDQILGARPLLAQLENVTLRESDSLLNFHFYGDGPRATIDVRIRATNCVFHLHSAASGLITLTGTENPLPRLRQLNIEGQILLLQADRRLVTWWHPESGQAEEVQPPGQIEGILVQQIEFPGEDLRDDSASQLIEYAGPRWNSAAPGIQAAISSDEPRASLK
ncbi:MAG: protein kinase [Planctomycetaceae bacterium]|nr:protein kinase [Planctomycetaceae bacterium]